MTDLYRVEYREKGTTVWDTVGGASGRAVNLTVDEAQENATHQRRRGFECRVMLQDGREPEGAFEHPFAYLAVGSMSVALERGLSIAAERDDTYPEANPLNESGGSK